MVHNRSYIHARMRELHAWLVEHDCKAGPEHGCQCSAWYEEMNMLRSHLIPHPNASMPRAGPMPGGSSGRDLEGRMNDVEWDNWWFLKQQENEE